MNRRFVYTTVLLAIFVSCSCFIWAADSALEPINVIDSPTTTVLDYGSYGLNFRLFSDGGILTRLNFGVFKIVTLGCGLEVSKVLGSSQDVIVGMPALFLKIKPFSGDMVLPSLSFGYDGQGYFYDRNDSSFRQKERGIFVVVGKEFIVSGLDLNIGANMNDFKTNIVYGFTNVRYNVEDVIFLLCEYDNIHNVTENRLNLGLRFFVTSEWSIDLAGRDIGAAGRFAERILSINYVGKF